MSPTLEDCPLCLERMDESDQVYPLLCSCQYNMCRSCIVHVIESSESGYSEASDGSMQMKTNQKCPQCRFDLRYTLRDTVILRQAHVARSVSKVADSQLNATLLRVKHEFLGQQEEVKLAAVRYRKAQEGASPISPEKKCATIEQSFSSDSVPPAVIKKGIDLSLFQGLEAWLNEAEQVYLSEMLTSGEVPKLVIAAHILHGVFEATILGHASLVAKAPESATQERKRLEREARFLKRYPLPRRMPRYAMMKLPVSRRDLMIRDEDDKENPPNEVADAMNKLIMDEHHVTNEVLKKQNVTLPCRKVVKIIGVKGAVGRLGLRKGDVITHLNGEEFKGTALELQNMLESNQATEINIIVNADQFTASLLKQRAEKARSGKD